MGGRERRTVKRETWGPEKPDGQPRWTSLITSSSPPSSCSASGDGAEHSIVLLLPTRHLFTAKSNDVFLTYKPSPLECYWAYILWTKTILSHLEEFVSTLAYELMYVFDVSIFVELNVNSR